MVREEALGVLERKKLHRVQRNDNIDMLFHADFKDGAEVGRVITARDLIERIDANEVAKHRANVYADNTDVVSVAIFFEALDRASHVVAKAAG